MWEEFIPYNKSWLLGGLHTFDAALHAVTATD